MGRAILKSLKESTLLTFFQVCREWGLFNDFTYNSIEGVIKWKNGSSVYLKDLFAYPSDPEFDSLGSTEYTGAFIDEASQITSKAKNIVMSRIRFQLDKFGLIPKLLIASNPSKNFLYFEFYKPWKEKKLEKYRSFVPALVGDNPFISKYYIENLHKLDRVSRERLLYGNFEYDDDPTKLFDYDSIMDLFTNDAERGEKFCIVDAAGFGRDKTIVGFWEGFFLTEVIIKENISSHELDELLTARKIPRSRVKDLPGIKGFVANARPIMKKKETESDKVLHNYKNLKAQCWFELANYVNAGKLGITKKISLEARELLIEDLEQIKQKDPGKDQPLNVLSKEEIKENLGRSTDMGDMLMMRMFFELKTPMVFGFISNRPETEEKTEEESNREKERKEVAKQIAEGKISFAPMTRGRRKTS